MSDQDKIEGRVRESADGLRRRSHTEVREHEQRLRERARRERERAQEEPQHDTDGD